MKIDYHPIMSSKGGFKKGLKSLVCQWLRICLAMQRTRVWSLVQEDSTCCGATKPVCHNYRAQGVLKLQSPRGTEARGPRVHTLQHEKRLQWEAWEPQQRVPLLAATRKRKKETDVTQLCPTLCNPMDCSWTGSSIHGIFQTRILKWVAISFSSCN